MTEHSDGRSFAIGLALGAVVGVAVALLYAPQSGQETRTMLREKAIKAKETAKEIIEEEATRSNMFYITERWLGGMLTNFSTIRLNIKRLKDLEKLRDDTGFKDFTKKEG